MGALQWVLKKGSRHVERDTVRVSPRAEDTFGRFDERSDDLLPGILNEVTLRHITTKLPWQTILVLSQVTHAWLDAIRSRLVYNARVRSHSTEALVAINHMSLRLRNRLYVPAAFPRPVRAIGLYSVNDRSLHQLPPIPCEVKGIPEGCQCACLDGRIYVLGGSQNSPPFLPSRKMYVMDLAGRGKWERCADMRFGRFQFGCGVMGSKIYVYGGLTWIGRPVHESEVYDPELDVWSSFRSLQFTRVNTHAVAMGNELVVHLAHFLGPIYNRGPWSGRRNSIPTVYNRIKDEWRKMDLGHCPCQCGGSCMRVNDQVMFVADGKIYQMTFGGIFVFDKNETKPWIRRCGVSWTPVVNGMGATTIQRWTPLAVDDELVMVVDWWHKRNRNERHLVYCTGFRGQKERIVWEKADYRSNPYRIESRPFMSVVKL